jgi:hypothetical protein
VASQLSDIAMQIVLLQDALPPAAGKTLAQSRVVY